eukprot:COSAG06_NODE_54406_length_294_cov_1.800000_1_plen_32_part_10
MGGVAAPPSMARVSLLLLLLGGVARGQDICVD